MGVIINKESKQDIAPIMLDYTYKYNTKTKEYKEI